MPMRRETHSHVMFYQERCGLFHVHCANKNMCVRPSKTSRRRSARVSPEMDGNQGTSNSTTAASTVIEGRL